MSFWTFIKLIAGAVVVAILGFTGMLAWHVAVEPVGGAMGGVIERVIPNPGSLAAGVGDEEFVAMLESADMPDIEPGERAFQRAHEMIALGRIGEAREKLAAIIHIHPTSSAAPAARRILGEMNVDEILSTTHMDDKIEYTVVRGDAPLAITGRHRTTLENLIHLNGLMELGMLRPGDRFILLPLDFRVVITPSRQSLALWRDGRFIREYPIVAIEGVRQPEPGVTRIDSKPASIGGRRVQPMSPEYAGAEKTIQLANGLVIRPDDDGDAQDDEEDEARPRGIYLRRVDMEELNLLVRPGNEVEFR